MASHKQGTSVVWKWLTLLFVLVSIGLLIGLIVALHKTPADIKTEVCQDGMDTSVAQISNSHGLFGDLTSDEIQNVYNYMFTVKSLDLKPSKESKIDSNTIALIQFHPPPKDKALAYLDQGKPKPERQAIVVVFKGADQPPIVEEYIVGPASAPIKHELRKVEGRQYPINFNARMYNPQENFMMDKMIANLMSAKVNRLLEESYDGYTHYNCTDRCLFAQFGAPFGLTSDTREAWYHFWRYIEGFYYYPINFEFYFNFRGNDPSKWRVEKILYNGQLFNSSEELMDAYDKGTLVKTFMPAPKGDDKLFSTYERRGKAQPSKPMRGPELYEPDGRRYAVSGRHIEYMNWAFDFRVDTSTGLQVYDVRFGGERVIYEISLQEAVASYTGYYPLQMGNHFLDSNFMMGANSHDLLQGTDCPGTAKFFDLVHMTFHDSPNTVKNAVCVFELNTGMPLRRHYDTNFMGGYIYYGAMVNQALVLRTIASVGNYDYIHDFIFYQNGAVEIKVSASGYTFGTFYDQNVEPYGYPIHDNLTSATHDHLLNYKVDLDVGGRENSFETIEIGIENVTYQWLPERNRHTIRKVLKRSTKKTELEAAYKFNFDHPKYLNFFNDKRKNKLGVKKGYRIQLNGIQKQLYPDDWLMVPMISWSLYQLAVTRYKDNERSSTSLYNQNAPSDPHVDFRTFLADNESIVNEDLVAWATIGMMHIPHSEDVPNTVTVGTSAGFFIRPFNYFDEDPSMGSTNAVVIKPIDNKYTPSFHYFGAPTSSKCVPRNYKVSFDGKHGM